MRKTVVCFLLKIIVHYSTNILRALVFCACFGTCITSLIAQATGHAAASDGIANPALVTMAQQPAPMPLLQPGKPIERELSGAETHWYRLDVPEHQYAKVVVEQRGVDVTVQVLDNTGAVLAEYDSESRLTGVEKLGIAADSTAVYQLKVKASYPKIAAGRYQIQIGEQRAATDKDQAEFEAHKLATRAATLRDFGGTEEALNLTQRALEDAEKSLDPDDAYIGELAMRVGQLALIRGNLENADAMLSRSIAVYEEVAPKQDPREGLALSYLGGTYKARYDMIKAEQYEEEALDIFRKTLGEEHPWVAGSLADISVYRLRRGDVTAAQSRLKAASAIADKTLEPDDAISLKLTHDLGHVYLEQNDYDRAEPLTEKALEGLEKKFGPNSYMLAPSLQNLGSIARVKKQYTRALELLERAEAIRKREIGATNPDTAGLLINIGNVYWDQNELTKAAEYFQRALGILQTSAGPYHALTRAAITNLAQLYGEMGDKPHALEYQQRTAEVVDKEIEFNLATGSERQRLAYSKWMAVRTDLIVSFHIQTAPQDKAAAELAALTILRRKALVLDSMSGNLAAIRAHMKPDDQKLIDELGGTDTQLAKIALSGPGNARPGEYLQQLHRLEEKKEELERDISEKGSGYFEKMDAITLEAIRSAIPGDAVLVEFAIYHPDFSGQHLLEGSYDPRYCVYIIRHEGDIQWADLGKTKEVDKVADALRQALQDPGRKDVQQLAHAADAKIFKPIRPLVGDATHLLIAPDGELDLIPFEALLDEQNRYLVQQFSVTYLTTGRDLLRLQKPRPNNNPPLLVADPLFDSPGNKLLVKTAKPVLGTAATGRRSITSGQKLSDIYFAPLIGSEREARAIHALFPDAQMLTGADATKAALEQVNAPRILHIATHGFFLEDQGNATPTGTKTGVAAGELENPLMRSGLALAGANSNHDQVGGGILTALEASNLNLWGTKLVTLSACDTGIGDVKNGEGVYGLRRAFVLAGAETLVMSLWPVSDEITREMMTSYYTGLKRGLGRGEALHRAQLAMLRQKGHTHPFYWASFIQSGEWANLDGTR
ncbi:MAG TPA: CHAT domain-containing tetratricopeptide repeat protein [Candidatus Angelobacter sp.]|nr:CHAT domain-containing tetratricopeptide repeat protein [Candidatus Angelobacter sp.]